MDKSLLEVAHETAKDLYEIGLLSQAEMQKFDELCLPAIKKTKHQKIKKLQLCEKKISPVFTRKAAGNTKVAHR